MNLFQNIKYGISCREAAERYGVEVNRCGTVLCPFHNDRHPSLYVADDHYYCFACGEHGDVIDFVGRLFQLSPYDTAQKPRQPTYSGMRMRSAFCRRSSFLPPMIWIPRSIPCRTASAQ